jgi:DNA topoisomerase-1
VGRFGPYIKHGDEFRSLAAGDDVLTIGLPRALELLSQPKGARGGQRRAPEPIRTLGAHPADGAPVVVMSGRFGPYVKHGAVNATLPRGTKPEGLTMDQAVTLLDERAKNPPAKPRRATRTANKPGTSTGTKKPAARKPTNRKKT